MPTVVGLTQQAAETAIEKASSRRSARSSTDYSENVAAGIVLSASESAGAASSKHRRRPGRLQRPEAAQDHQLPTASRPTRPDALTKAGFAVVEPDRQLRQGRQGPGDQQDPKSGGAMKGDTITITRSLGPVMVTVPTSSRMGVRAAQKVMHDAGFKTKVQPVAVNYIGVGFVVYSSPRVPHPGAQGLHDHPVRGLSGPVVSGANQTLPLGWAESSGRPARELLAFVGVAGHDGGLGLDVLPDQGHRHPDAGPRPAGGPVRHRHRRPAADRRAAAARCRGRPCCCGVGLGLLYGIAQILQTAGLAHTSASVSGFITGLYVVATPLLGALILRSRIPPTDLAGGRDWRRSGLGVLSLHGFSIGYGELLTLAVGDHLRRAHRRAGPAEHAGHGDESQRGADVRDRGAVLAGGARGRSPAPNRGSSCRPAAPTGWS